MGQVRMAGGGSSVDLDVTTATAGDVVLGKVILDIDANLVQGTLALSGTAGDCGGSQYRRMKEANDCVLC